MDSITFQGSIADTTTAIRVSGRNEGGGRVTFDVPDSQMGALAGLMAVRGCALVVRVEVEAQG